jgi:hypothetical protein
VLEYHRRGWTTSSAFKVDGEILNSKGQCVYKIDGNWSKHCYLTNPKGGDRELIWTKNPYPEKWDYMYGMSHFMLQLNHLPKHLRKWLPPTDTRWRTD